MKNLIHALPALVALGCGQAAPEPEATSNVESGEEEHVAVNRDEFRVPSDDTLSAPAAPDNTAVPTKPFRCETDLLPRDEPAALVDSALAAPPRKPFVRTPVVREPLRPEVVETLPPQ